MPHLRGLKAEKGGGRLFLLPFHLGTESRAWATVGLSETRGAGGKRPGGEPAGVGDFPARVS